MSVRSKCIAISSGKGGVGKSTTALNLALYFARKGKKVLLVDIDPLSDIKTILDFGDPETGNENIQEIFDRLYIFTPFSKTGIKKSSAVFNDIKNNKYFDIENEFEIIIMDMPAGADEEENIAFLQFADMLIVVTNPDPIAHTASGSYIKKVLKTNSQIPIFIWHNRFIKIETPEFDSENIIGNYNKNVPASERLSDETAEKIKSAAFIPEDPSLNLLKTESSPNSIILGNINILLDLIYEELCAEKLASLEISRNIQNLIAGYLSENRDVSESENYINSLFEYLELFINRKAGIEQGLSLSEAISDSDRKALNEILDEIKNDKTMARIITVKNFITNMLGSLETSENHADSESRDINMELSKMLTELDGMDKSSSAVKNLAGIIIFYLALFKLFKREEFKNMIADFIPKKITKNGTEERDRHKQICNLIQKNREYKESFFGLIKKFYPHAMREIKAIIKSYGLKNIYFKDQSLEINREIYTKLISTFLHDSINSGLSIIVGFPYRTSSVKFQKAGDYILDSLK